MVAQRIMLGIFLIVSRCYVNVLMEQWPLKGPRTNPIHSQIRYPDLG